MGCVTGDGECGDALEDGDADVKFGGPSIEGEASSRHRSEADTERP